MIKIGIVGGAGYAAGELIRVLLNHPVSELVFVNSTSNAGNRLSEVHEGILGETDMCFTDQLFFDEIDVVFFCLGHGKSTQFLSEHHVPKQLKIIDFAQDFRLKAEGNDYIYGLPELQPEAIGKAVHVANPGCFATCIQLGLLPLASAGVLQGTVPVNAITGSTGAGVKPTDKTHFSWRTGNMSVYKAFRHQHVPEIIQSIKQLQPSYDGSVEFLPYRGGFSRGIFATEVVRTNISQGEIDKIYQHFYKDAPFTFYSTRPIDMKQVVNTNKCIVHAERIDDKLLITSCIDNLLKGAAGQAVENMNLMFDIPEDTGLHLKSVAF